MALHTIENILGSQNPKIFAKEDQENHSKRKMVVKDTKCSKRVALGNVTNLNIQTRSKTSKEGIEKTKSDTDFSRFVETTRKPLIKAATFVPGEQSKCVSPAKKEEKEAPLNARPVPVRDLPPGCEYDVDVAFWTNPARVPEYAQDVIQYLKAREEDFRVPEDHLKIQTNIKTTYRPIMVDWMIHLMEVLGLLNETLYKGVKLLDLYLTNNPIKMTDCQLVCCACMYIMSKYDHPHYFHIKQFVYMCEGVSEKLLRKMEREILYDVEFNLGFPDAYTFLRRWGECARLGGRTLILARYVLEMSLLANELVSKSESKMASAALYVAMRMLEPSKRWTTTIEYYTGYKVEDFRDIAIALNDNLRKEYPGLYTTREKYSDKVFLRVARIPLKTNEQLFEDQMDTSDK